MPIPAIIGLIAQIIGGASQGGTPGGNWQTTGYRGVAAGAGNGSEGGQQPLNSFLNTPVAPAMPTQPTMPKMDNGMPDGVPKDEDEFNKMITDSAMRNQMGKYYGGV
jgi:hypothetical protein